jgi:hypothetical protein
MKSLSRRLERVEKRICPVGFEVVVQRDGETKEQARERAGLAEWPGTVIFISEADAGVL